MVSHKNGNTMNCSIDNLSLVDENKDHGDLNDFRPFHENTVEKRIDREAFS